MDPTLGDINFGAFYQALKESQDWPDIVVSVRAKAPTGTSPFGIELNNQDLRGNDDPNDPNSRNDNLITPLELPSGNGVWTINPGISVVKTVDPAVLFANLSYFYNVEDSFGDIGSADGNQPGSVSLGDAIQFGLGTAFALNEKMSMSFSYSQRLTNKTKVQGDGAAEQTVIGSDANTATVGIGLTYALSERLSMSTNVGIGLTPDAPDVQVGVRFPYSF